MSLLWDSSMIYRVKRSIIMAVFVMLPPLSAGADCVITKDAGGKYTHICDDYKADSFEVPSKVGKAFMGPQQTVSAPYQYDRDAAYMSDFGDDTLWENLDYGAEDDPGTGF